MSSHATSFIPFLFTHIMYAAETKKISIPNHCAKIKVPTNINHPNTCLNTISDTIIFYIWNTKMLQRVYHVHPAKPLIPIPNYTTQHTFVYIADNNQKLYTL